MPMKYEEIRDALIKRGYSTEDAKAHAARIYNAGRKPGEAPVTNAPDSERMPAAKPVAAKPVQK